MKYLRRIVWLKYLLCAVVALAVFTLSTELNTARADVAMMEDHSGCATQGSKAPAACTADCMMLCTSSLPQLLASPLPSGKIHHLAFTPINHFLNGIVTKPALPPPRFT